MQFDKKDLTVAKVRHDELAHLERIFIVEFGEEMGVELIQSRIRRIRQFYYLLLPLSEISPWIRGLFNIYVIKIKGEFAGFIQLSPSGKKQLHLDFIAIRKSFRQKGLGEYVLRGLLKDWADARGYGVILEVRLDNPAYRLYQKLGFQMKVQILHYECEFNAKKDEKIAEHEHVSLERMKNADRRQLPSLYCVSMPNQLSGIVQKNQRDFTPSMFLRQVNDLKNKLMRQTHDEYVLKMKEKVIAKIDIRSYVKAKRHVLHIMLHPAYELLRMPILKQVMSILKKSYREGKIITNIYDDMIGKQHALERNGFLKTEAYFFMFRPPLKRKQVDKQSKTILLKKMKKRRIKELKMKLVSKKIKK